MRLIDADALKNKAIKVSTTTLPHVYMKAVGTREIDNAPTIDAVQVVRCKDCKHKDLITAPNGYIYCTRLDICAPDDGFCHKGEMMRGDTDAVD